MIKLGLGGIIRPGLPVGWWDAGVIQNGFERGSSFPLNI